MHDFAARMRIGALVWLPMAAAITVLAGMVYVVAQQNLRMSANDPQIQMVQDAAVALAAGQPTSAIVPSKTVDIRQSLAPYMMVFDDTGNIVASSAWLNGQTPVVPPGVFAYTREHGENRVTWQPEPGVRGATVMARYEGANPGFVLVGRSLREVEKRIGIIGLLTSLAWIAALGAALVVAAVGGGGGPLAVWAGKGRLRPPQYQTRQA